MRRRDEIIEVVKRYLSSITTTILESSTMLTTFKDNPKLAEEVLSFIDERVEKGALLDLGCGYGHLAMLLKEALGFQEAYGVDINEERLSIASKLGLVTYRLDLEKDSFPLPSKYFDLVIMAGVLNHLKFWDNILIETRRVLKPKGLIFISNPNLGSWIDRISLLLGYQPPTVEVSRVYCVGLPPPFPRKRSIEYVHSTTVRAMKELLSIYGFKTLKIWPVKIPKLDLERKVHSKLLGIIVRIVDVVMSKFPSFATRYLIIAEKTIYYYLHVDKH
jgi:ubiquinone/menaquinone biosynthesis C-methylase UbiE